MGAIVLFVLGAALGAAMLWVWIWWSLFNNWR